MTQEFLLQNSWLIALALGSGLMLVLPFFLKRGPEVTVAQATQMLNQKKATLIDIRDDATVKQNGMVTQAKRVLLSDLADKVGAVAKDKSAPVLVLCQVGQKSVGAAATLKKLGYTEAYSVQGGFVAWKEAGMPIKKSA